jgi:cytochrome c oxidase cbb3-type subunit 4
MSYDTISRLVQQGGEVYFGLIFAVICVYAFWPRNKAKFDRAARLPLEDDELS